MDNSLSQDQIVLRLKLYNRPVLFFSLSLVLPWLAWFLAAHVSYIQPMTTFYLFIESVLIVLGSLIPATVGLVLILSNKELKNDFLKNKVFNYTSVKGLYWLLAIFLVPLSLIVGQLISIFLGYSVSQFRLSSSLLNSVALVPFWLIFLYVPIVEELGWRGYGVDTLRNRFSLFSVILMFAIFWCAWHIPLFFINGYIHFDELVAMGWIYVANYFISILIITFLIMWLYYKSNRNIFVPILFHLSTDAIAELFQTHPDSKLIQTILLTIVCVLIFIKDQKFFFERDYQEQS